MFEKVTSTLPFLKGKIMPQTHLECKDEHNMPTLFSVGSFPSYLKAAFVEFPLLPG